MNKLLFFVVLLLSMCMFSDFNSSAHGGRTDSSGGHNCSAKSQAKGLCTGYHYHNGGSSSSTTLDTNGTDTTLVDAESNDKDCDDFTDYDEVVDYWNTNGYSATYDPENLDGFGKKVDDGIPCEPPSDYDLTKVNNSKQQTSAKEKSEGANSGEVAGLADGYKNIEKKSTVAGTKAYQNGYSKAYAKSYKIGQKKFNKEKEDAYDQGYALGNANKKLKVPSTLAAIHAATFKSAYQDGQEVYTEEKIDDYYDLGYDDGQNDTYNSPDVEENSWIESYEKGYQDGQEVLQENYTKQGYQSAFENVKYVDPDTDNEKLIGWYKEGFESNAEVKEIQDYAFEQGKSGEDLAIPDKYNQAKSVYKHFYEKGKEEYVSPAPYITGGVAVAGGAGYLLYRRKKKGAKQ